MQVSVAVSPFPVMDFIDPQGRYYESKEDKDSHLKLEIKK